MRANRRRSHIPFLAGRIGEFPAQDDAAGFETKQRFLYFGRGNSEYGS